MRYEDIAKFLKIDRKTVYRILKDTSSHRVQIEQVRNLRNFETTTLETEFKDKLFLDICNLVISKLKRNKDFKPKRISGLIQFATLCKKWHFFLAVDKDIKQFDATFILSIKKEPYDLFVCNDFIDMMEYAINEGRKAELREKAAELLNLSLEFNWRLKK